MLSVETVKLQRWHSLFGGELIKDLLLPTLPRTWPAEDVGNHDQGQPEAPLRTASPWLPTMEKGLCENFYLVSGVPVARCLLLLYNNEIVHKHT